MVTKSVEQRLAELEKANKDLQGKLESVTREAERAYAATECLRMISKYCYYHVQGRDREWYLESFAKNVPDVAVGHGQMGVCVGHESLRGCFLHSEVFGFGVYGKPEDKILLKDFWASLGSHRYSGRGAQS